jgi:PHD/YefM family antitoxin component YafN of YafNO toxin-antitoxin module
MEAACDDTVLSGSDPCVRAVYAFGYALRMQLPEVLSFREFRAGLAATFKRVQEPGSGPVFVGAHRKAEAVVMSVSQYQVLVEAAERRDAVSEALASVRAEGLEPSDEDLRLFTAVAAGDMTTDELRGQVLARCHR